MSIQVFSPLIIKSFEKNEWEITRVLIADDHPRVRAGIRNLLEKDPQIQVVGEACDGEEALRLVEELKPEVLLLDIEMPRMNGIEVARELQSRKLPIKVLILSAYSDHQYIRNMVANGVAGYLTKEDVPTKVVQAVRGIVRGEEGWISRKVASQIRVWGSGQKKYGQMN